MSSARTNLFLFLVVLWPIWLIAIWALWNYFRDNRDEKLVEKSLAWPETQGSVTSSLVEWAHVEVSYDYHVAGQLYSGVYQISLTPRAPDRSAAAARAITSEAQDLIAGYPPGSKVVIRYNPRNPAESSGIRSLLPGRTKQAISKRQNVSAA
jgi:Protein of unknown function (DUF3592)